MPDPQVTVDLARIERNARVVTTRAKQSGIDIFGVTKGSCGMPSVARAMLRGGVVGLAESRFENIRRLRDSGLDCPIMLLRSPPLVRVEELVRSVDISLQSELPLIREISRTAERLGRVHDVILMIDLGDLREGIWPNDLIPTVEEIMTLPGVRIAGVGTNLTCFGAIMPTEDNLNQLVAHAYKVESVTGSRLDWVSGGNSSSLPLLLSGEMPHGVNNLRIGEAILQGGRDTFLDKPWQELDMDAFELTGELLEVKVKPSLPIGKSGVDAFGNTPHFIDEGDRLRGIANIGREDVMVDGLIPTNPGVRVLGASSDHLMLDLTDANPPLASGDTVGFRLNYGALLAVMTSEYVEKAPLNDVQTRVAIRRIAFNTSPDAAWLLKTYSVERSLSALGIEVADPAMPALVDGKTVSVFAGASRATAWAALTHTLETHDSVGLVWIDAFASATPDPNPDGQAGERTVLRRILERLPPHVSPENIALVGLRETDPAEAAFLKASRCRVFTMTEIDTVGIRHVMREALKVASAGTKGFHAAYSPHVTDMAGWMQGLGGITARETHQVMELLAQHPGMLSLSLSGMTTDLPSAIAAEYTHFVLSAFGKNIL
ncbi:alanine racemase [Labrys miyagiensis]|uniref:Alanine racemase n=1 Tax=Labrys miyagiensis TaxID=346912 RepID=A0ABQ6CQK0_9HYPH|nr:alanine racemase [Labrys miyagiensis]GLS22434.1 alanine racemase [Labrys miyagiensis]